MPKKTIFRGSVANDGTGDNLRFGAEKINDNFTELYTLLGDGSTLSAGTIVTTTETQTITNKTIDGSNNTITNIPASALAFNSITIGDDTSTNFNVELGGSFEIVGGSGINTAITNNRIELSTDGSIVTESSTDTLTNKTIAAGSNTITGLTNTNLSGTAGITNANLANSSIRIGDDSSSNFDVGLGESFEITGGTGVTTAITNNRIELSVGSIPNSSLTNSSLTLGATSVSLGATAASASNFSLTGSSSVSGTGTIDLTGAGSKARFDFAGYGSLPTASTYVGMYAYDSTGNRPYYSSGAGWVRILDENSSVQDHTDVNMSGVADGNVLTWSSAQGRFNVTAPAGGSVALNDVTDVSVSSPQKGHTLVYTGSNWEVAQTPVSQFVVTAPTSSAYQFDGAGFPSGTSGNNPDIHLKKGQTYYFRNTSGGHPFRIQSTTGTSGTAYNTGVTNNNASGPSGVIIFHVPQDAPATLYYQCTLHAAMNGTINVA